MSANKSKDQRNKKKRKLYSLLEKTYYNTSNAGAYAGPDKLYKVLKAQGVDDVGKHTIRKWLQNQDDYSLQKYSRKTFKKARVVVSNVDEEHDSDLADFSSLAKENDGVKYVLFVIDIFSRYLWVEPLKNKTAKDVVAALKKIYAKGRKPKKYRSDKGGEYTSKLTKNYLKSQDIYAFTTANSNTKANYAERVIKTIKKLIYRYFTKNRTHRYIDILQDIVQNYNATPHRSLHNIAPKDVSKENSADIFAYMYLRPQKTFIKKPKATRFHFKKGDMVRVSYTNFLFERSYDEHFSREIFKIRQRFRQQGIPMYRLIDFSNEEVKGNFYESELQRVSKHSCSEILL